jgi:dUTP pyrophosphatase
MEEATSVAASLMNGFDATEILQELEADLPTPDGLLITTPSDKDSLKTVAVPPTPPIKYWLCDVRACPPIKKEAGDAGFDVFSLFEITMYPGTVRKIPIGVQLVIPSGYYCQIAPRSGLSATHALQVLAGVVDRSYTGPVCVVLYNAGHEAVSLPAHSRIAQLLFVKIHDGVELVPADEPPPRKSSRGSKGFGQSTGLY